MNPRYPIYVISKGRWESRLTVKTLEEMNVPYHVVVEPQEYLNYSAVIEPENIYVLPFSNLGRGSIPARNWVWKHAISTGAERHWILDDNINGFVRLNRNRKIRVVSGAIFCAAEDFVDRYENVALAGFHYRQFKPQIMKLPPFITNTRIYSTTLIKNDIPYRWRGKYNEDTDLSLRVLKDGYCTILFYAFMQNKVRTMTMTGGNSDELYQGDGRLRMAKSLQRQHPDLVKIKWLYGRWQHFVDYRGFQSNELIKKDNLQIAEGVNEYGMVLIDMEKMKRV